MNFSRLLGGAAIVLQLVLCQAAAQTADSPSGDALFETRDGALFAYLAQPKSLLVSGTQGESWEPVRNAQGRALHVDYAAQSAGAGGSVWAASDTTLWRLASDTQNTSVTLPAGFETESIRTHPAHPECVLVNGQNSAVLGCLDWAEQSTVLRFVDDAASCEFAGTTKDQLDYFCAMRQPGAALQLNSRNEAPQKVLIDGSAVTDVEQLVRTPTHIVAVARPKGTLRLAVYPLDSQKWSWSALPDTRGSSQATIDVLPDSETLLVIATTNSGRELWTANAMGTRFTKQLDLGPATVKRIGRALYAQDKAGRVAMSKDNGRRWSTDLDIVPDVASVQTSDRLNVGYNAEQSMIALSYDGIQWTLKPMPPTGADNIVLLDFGAAVMLWAHRENKLHLSVTAGRDWYSEPLIDASWMAQEDRVTFSRGPLVFTFDNSADAGSGIPAVHVVNLSQAMGNRACSQSDLEEIQDSECVLGTRRSQWVHRRAANNALDYCILGPSSNFMPPPVQHCPCSVADYECDDMFVPSGGQSCAPGPELSAKLAKCKPGDVEFVSKGYVRIPGDQCRGGDQLSGPTYFDCSANEIMVSASGQSINSNTVSFDGQFKDYLYLPSVETAGTDETVLLTTAAGELFVSQDQGSTWTQQLNTKDILAVIKSDTPANQIYAFTSDSVERSSVWISWDRARTFEEIIVPSPPNIIFGLVPQAVSFHPKHPDWILYTGVDPNCKNEFECFGITYLSKDRGKKWAKILEKTASCHWVYGLVNPTSDDFMYCFVQDEDNIFDMGFVYSEDYFTSGAKTIPGLERVVGTILDRPFVVAGRDKVDGGVDTIEGLVSLNGKDFAPMRFPPNVVFDKTSGFTLMSTVTQSIVMFATANPTMAHEFGTLLKSNSNGTDFIVALENVNRGMGLLGGFVDFERIQSIEGVALANIVGNANKVARNGESKKLQTLITHSDGSLWSSLTAPEGMCDNQQPNCYLHLHGYTERLDRRNAPSSPSAVGLIVARGNVGEYLGEMRSAQTFMSRDGGVSWKRVHERPMYWEFGDSGSIVVLVDSQESTNKLSYSLDEGETWNEYEFSDVPIAVKNLATIPSDTSRKFIIFGQPPVAYGDKTLAIQVDFSGIAPKQCEASDFEPWTPIHPLTKSPCLFGHEAVYQRKKPGRACYVGKTFSEEDGTVKKPPIMYKNCKCQRSDFECDYNYKIDPKDGTCKLISGLNPQDRDEQCKGGAVAWHKVTGYRRLPISTCEGGEELSSDEEYPCPGMEKEFEQRRGGKHRGSSSLGRSILGTLLIIVLIIAVLVIGFVGFTWAKSRGWTSADLPVHLPDSFDTNNVISASATSSLDFLEKAWVQLSDFWALASSHLPFIGQRSPQDHLGFYSRMGEERYRILESDESEGYISEDNDEQVDAPTTEPERQAGSQQEE